MAKAVDYIIVGQGLAGSCLALRLLALGKRVAVFDTPGQNKSSVVAAGLFNPITGKQLTRTWQADKIFPELFRFYSEAEHRLASKFFYPQPLYRPFVSIQEQNEWMIRSADETIAPFIDRIFTSATFGQAHDVYGGMLLSQGGYLDVNQFLKSVRDYLIQHLSFHDERFDESNLETHEDFVMYKQCRASKLVLCTGVIAGADKKLPIRLLKGETLTLKLSQVPELIFNRGVYIVPWKDGTYKAGATYDTNLTPEITQAGRMELEQKIGELLKLGYEVVGQDWGLRPTTPDRRPILGSRPGSKNVVFFNGLGTKGVSLAPYFSAQLANWMVGVGEIQSEVNITRFKSLSSKFE